MYYILKISGQVSRVGYDFSWILEKLLTAFWGVMVSYELFFALLCGHLNNSRTVISFPLYCRLWRNLLKLELRPIRETQGTDMDFVHYNDFLKASNWYPNKINKYFFQILRATHRAMLVTKTIAARPLCRTPNRLRSKNSFSKTEKRLNFSSVFTAMDKWDIFSSVRSAVLKLGVATLFRVARFFFRVAKTY